MVQRAILIEKKASAGSLIYSTDVIQGWKTLHQEDNPFLLMLSV